MRAGCYVKLSRDITMKKAVINDGQCVLRMIGSDRSVSS